MIMKCDICGKKYSKPGAVLWGPPVGRLCLKYHICSDCYGDVLGNIIKTGIAVDKWNMVKEIMKVD